MNRKAIGRILFTFSCMIAMVLVFGLQAPDMHAYAVSGGTVNGRIPLPGS